MFNVSRVGDLVWWCGGAEVSVTFRICVSSDSFQWLCRAARIACHAYDVSLNRRRHRVIQKQGWIATPFAPRVDTDGTLR